MTMTGQRKRIFLLILFIAVIVMVRYSPLGSIFTVENLKQHRETLVAAVRDNYALSVAIYIAVYILTAALSVPGALILTLTGGFLFGTIACTVYVDIGATVGAALAFLSARYLLGNTLQDKYQLQLRKFNEEIKRNGTNYLLTLRLIPVFPFFLINFLSGLTNIPLKTFTWTTLIGIIPSTAVFSFAGQRIGSINSLSELLSAKILAAFAALALITLVPVIWKRVVNIKRASGR